MNSALSRYRALAYATGVFLLLLTGNVIAKYVLHHQGLGVWVGITHGWLYLGYVVITVDLWFRARLPVGRTLLVLLAGTVPFMSFVAERWVTKHVRPLAVAEAAEAAAASEGQISPVGSSE